jgi:lipoprotein-anchoring transpeptidase ErfK/SrfK
VRRVALLLLLLPGVCAIAVPARADTATTVPEGILLGGLPVGGLTPDEAVAALTARFSRPVELRIGQTKVTVTPAQLGARLYADSAVAAALEAEPGTTLGFRALVSRKTVKAYVARLAKRLDRTAKSSRLLLDHLRPLVTPSVTGRRILQGPTALRLVDEVAHGTRAPIVVPLTLIPPQASAKTIGPVIVIRRGSNLLTLYRGDRYVRQFHVATGQAVYPTPLGRFQIVVKWKYPTWYPPTQDAWAKGLKPVPPGPNNPLGTRWMGISSPGVGIHGTDEPASIGYSESHGCIRMLVPDAEWLFDHVTVGTTVFIVPA